MNEAGNPANSMAAGRNSYQGHTQNRRSAMRDEDDLAERVKKALVYLDGLGLDLPILLHALSWGNEPLISDSVAKYHRGVLMNSLEFPEIVKQWSKRSEAARTSLTRWAGDHITQCISTEMNAAVEKLRCDGDDLSEETFLSITPQSMALLLKPEVPTLWRVLKSASRTNQQEKRNKEDSKKVWTPTQTENRICLPFT